MEKSDTPPSGFVGTDDFLDFTLDNDGEEEKGDGKPISKGATDAAALGHGTRASSAPDVSVKEEEEEELEWLSNKDAFPPVESFFSFISDHQESPASVLENTNANSNNGSAVAVSAPTRNMQERKRKVDSDDYFPPLSGRRVKKKMCSHCKTDKTPQWRAGPMGPKTLCNACGVRFKTGNLLPEYRPKNSPTFSTALHSNSRKKVEEMSKKKQGGGDI